jgi:hypothetical protein
MLMKIVRRPTKRPRMRVGTRSPIQATHALLATTLKSVLTATMARNRWSFVAASTSSAGSATRGSKLSRDRPTAQSVTVRLLRALVSQAAGRLTIWAPSGSAPRKPTTAALAPR